MNRGRTPNPSTGLSGVAEFAAAYLGLGPQHVRCFGTGTTPELETRIKNPESRIQPPNLKNPTPRLETWHRPQHVRCFGTGTTPTPELEARIPIRESTPTPELETRIPTTPTPKLETRVPTTPTPRLETRNPIKNHRSRIPKSGSRHPDPRTLNTET